MDLFKQLSEDLKPPTTKESLDIKAGYLFKCAKQKILTEKHLAAQLNAVYIQGRIDESKLQHNEN